ncbi:hypothetical protein RE476_08325 [Methanolobus mangrovi]|uniref:DUF7343 domain-containing protein n=1 Tax=Methanolobus mangrovi TaxID=3072977 RepID=A0AA51YIB1_9EURY|nr:hypothetical protein [Methanolobus mangrovi]WMW21410.1 hypothetical protein RE476_08325 [Methanolobus mangrovi]
MRITYCAGCIAIILLFSGIASAEYVATVHGVAYEWNTFDPLANTIIEVNSTPVQSIVAKYGIYSFELPKGTYRITASYYEGDQLTYYGEDVITVLDEGNYVVDLLLLPSYSPTPAEEYIDSAKVSLSVSLLAVSVVIMLILVVSLFYQIRKKPLTEPHIKHNLKYAFSASPVKVSSPKEKAAFPEQLKSQFHENIFHSIVHEDEHPPKDMVHIPEPLSTQHKEILDILKSHGGTMSQRELRKFLVYSEGKVSVMLLDLEKRGDIRKIRKGRGNILFLTGLEE